MVVSRDSNDAEGVSGLVSQTHAVGVPLSNGNGNATKGEVFQMCAQWTSKVPVNNHVYERKTLQCDDAEWRTRVDLAAAYRQCYRMGLCEAKAAAAEGSYRARTAGVNNHLTAAIPGKTNRFLVFPFGLRWCEVTASNLLVVDAEGHVVDGKGEPEATAFYIHSRLHMRHPKGMVVFHTHQSWTSALCALEEPNLLMCHQNSLRFYEDWVWDSYGGLVLDNSEGDHLADIMGSKRVLLHQNHGVIICAESVASCFDFLYYLERAAKVQVLAMSTGRPVKVVDDKVAAGFKNSFNDSGVREEYARIHFESLKREMLASKQDEDFLT